MRARLALALLVAACTPTERPPEQRRPPITPAAPVPVLADVPPAPLAAAVATTWHWSTATAPDAARPWTPDEVVLELPDGEVKVGDDGDAGCRVSLREGDRRWETHVGAGWSDAAAVAATDDAIYVAHYHRIATGARVAKLDRRDGTTTWDVALYGVGPVAHSKYRNDVQIEAHDDGLHVYGWESGGAYVEVIALDDGRQLAHAPVDPRLVDLPWQWQGDPNAWTREPVRLDLGAGTSAALVDDGRRAALVVEGPDGVAATIALPHAEGELATGAGVVHDGILYFVHASAIATGATLYAIDLDGRRISWAHPLFGAGPVAHSEYFNAVRIAYTHDHVVVHGNEVAARYLEVVAPATGASIVHRIWTGR